MSYIAPMLPLLLSIAALGIILRARCPKNRASAWLIVLGLGGLFLLSFPPASRIALATLEGHYAPRLFPEGEAEAIVVLASYRQPPVPWRPYPVLDGHSYHRCLRAAWLYRNWRPLPVLACGGDPENQGSYAAAMKGVIEKEGVPAELVWTEERSTSTHENAAFAAGILRQKGIRRIAVVTEAYHMLRAERCFRREGLEVVPAPCRFEGLESTEHLILPNADAIDWNDLVLHEWVGLLWYRLRGWN